MALSKYKMGPGHSVLFACLLHPSLSQVEQLLVCATLKSRCFNPLLGLLIIFCLTYTE